MTGEAVDPFTYVFHEPFTVIFVMTYFHDEQVPLKRKSPGGVV